jgi:hypothetical protein
MNKKAAFNTATGSAPELTAPSEPLPPRSRTGRRGIFEHNGHYYREGNPPRRLSTFTLVPVREFRKPALPGWAPEIQGRIMAIYAGGGLLGEAFFDHAMWLSRTRFIKATHRFPQCFFFGTNNDVQAIKHYLDQNHPPSEIVVAEEADGDLIPI